MLFDFRSPAYVCNYLYNLDQNISSANSLLPIAPLIVNKIIFTILANISIPQYTFYSIPSILLYFYLLLLYLSTFSPPYFCLQQSLQVFSLPQPFSQFRLNQESLVRTDALSSSSRYRHG